MDEISMWLARCFDHEDIGVTGLHDISRGSGCIVRGCTVTLDKNTKDLVLKIYRPGFDNYSRLGVIDTARKHALALTEMPALGIPTPHYIGFASAGDEAAIVMEKVSGQPFTHNARIAAAYLLAKLHTIPLTHLSTALAKLVSRSYPNKKRVGEVPGKPLLKNKTLVHGDYFSVNLVWTHNIQVLDWDLLALGDPMWDLGFLLEADRNIGEQEAKDVIEAYKQQRPIDEKRLSWQRQCWQAYWKLKDRNRKST